MTKGKFGKEWALSLQGFPGGASGKKKSPPANAGDIREVGLIPGYGRSPKRGNGNPL